MRKKETYDLSHSRVLATDDRLGPVDSLDPRDRERRGWRVVHWGVVLKYRAQLGNRASFALVIVAVVDGVQLGKLHFLVVVAVARRHGGNFSVSGDQSDPLRGSEGHTSAP